MSRPQAELVGTGRYVPEKVLTNAQLERMVDTTDEWIQERTGIRERRIAGPEESIAHMARVACEQVLADSGVDVLDVDTIVLATASPDRYLPSTGCDLQATLGAANAAAFDVGAACSGFLYGVTVAEGLIASGRGRHILVVGAERLSTITNYQDRATCILFGDGVGASMVRAAGANGRGILSSYLKSDGRLGHLLFREGGGANRPPDERLLTDGSYYIHMAGREVFKAAVRSMGDAACHAVTRAGLSVDDIDLMIPHQANFRIIEATARHAGIPMDRVYVNLDRYGNTSAASIPLALDECVRAGRVAPGSTVLMVAFGGGFTWASMVVRW